jgi:hypothetical protein
MNKQYMQINALSKHPVIQLIGICNLYDLENSDKQILFGALTIKQKKSVDILIKLLVADNPSFDDFIFKVTFQLKRIGKINSDVQYIIFKMRELVDAFKTHYNLADDYLDDFREFMIVWRNDAPYNGSSYIKFLTRKEPLYEKIESEHILNKLDILIRKLVPPAEDNTPVDMS